MANIVYDAPLDPSEIERKVGDLTIPPGADHVKVETERGLTTVYYQKGSGSEPEGLGYQKFDANLQETIIRYLVPLHAGYTEDLD